MARFARNGDGAFTITAAPLTWRRGVRREYRSASYRRKRRPSGSILPRCENVARCLRHGRVRRGIDRHGRADVAAARRRKASRALRSPRRAIPASRTGRNRGTEREPPFGSTSSANNISTALDRADSLRPAGRDDGVSGTATSTTRTGRDIAIPLLLSTAGYGLFFDNRSLACDRGRRVDSDHSGSTTHARTERSTSISSREGLAWRTGRGRGASRPRADAAALEPRLPSVDPPFRECERVAAAPSDISRKATAVRRDHPAVDLRRRPWAGTKASARLTGILNSRRIQRTPELGFAHNSFTSITHEYPVLQRESPFYAEARARGLPSGRRLSRYTGRKSSPGELHARAALHRFLVPCRAGMVVGAASRPCRGGSGRLVARRRRRPTAPRPQCMPGRVRHCTTATTCCDIGHSRKKRRGIAATLALSCCVARAAPVCSVSAPQPGPATSTIRSQRSKRSLHWAST